MLRSQHFDMTQPTNHLPLSHHLLTPTTCHTRNLGITRTHKLCHPIHTLQCTNLSFSFLTE